MTVDAAALPRLQLPVGKRLYRIHRAGNAAWFFDGSGRGRFDPAGTPGRGACCWAEDPLAAFIEVFRTNMTPEASDISDRRLSEIILPTALTVADLTVREALAAGVTAALTAGIDYAPSHELADRLQSLAAGVRWRARHDLEQQLISVALFGVEGLATDGALGTLPVSATGEIPQELVDQAEDMFGYQVLPKPS